MAVRAVYPHGGSNDFSSVKSCWPTYFEALLRRSCCLNSGGRSALFVLSPLLSPARYRVVFCPRRCDAVNGFGGSFHESFGRSLVGSVGCQSFLTTKPSSCFVEVSLSPPLHTLHTRWPPPTFPPRTPLCPQVVRPLRRRRPTPFLSFPIFHRPNCLD